MDFNTLYQKLDFPYQIIDKLNATAPNFNLSEYEKQIKGMGDIETAADSFKELKELLGEDKGAIKMLLCQLEVVRRDYDIYMEKGISEKIFIDTMKCFTRFINECYEKIGEYNFDRGWWTYRQLALNIFRIGELEYQFSPYNGETVIELHIPSDAHITPEDIETSFAESREFLKKYYPDYKYNKYICESWLLSPRLKDVLDENSNIIKFQNRFTITETFYDIKDYLIWVFKKPMDTPLDKLPQKTSLQKKLVKLLSEGGNIGEAKGYINL